MLQHTATTAHLDAFRMLFPHATAFELYPWLNQGLRRHQQSLLIHQGFSFPTHTHIFSLACSLSLARSLARLLACFCFVSHTILLSLSLSPCWSMRETLIDISHRHMRETHAHTTGVCNEATVVLADLSMEVPRRLCSTWRDNAGPHCVVLPSNSHPPHAKMSGRHSDYHSEL